MKKISLICTALLLIFLCVPVNAATTETEPVINAELIEYTDTGKSGSLKAGGDTAYTSVPQVTGFYVKDITRCQNLAYIVYETPGAYGWWQSELGTGGYPNLNTPLIPTGRYDIWYSINGNTKPAVVYISRQTDGLGQITKTKMQFFFQDWTVSGLSGSYTIDTPIRLFGMERTSAYDRDEIKSSASDPSLNIVLSYQDGAAYPSQGGDLSKYLITYASTTMWANNLNVNAEKWGDVTGYNITILRTLDGYMYNSKINITKESALILTSTKTGTNESFYYLSSDIDEIKITSPTRQYTYYLNEAPDDPDDPDAPDNPDNITVTVYVRNSQTNTLLANANIDISASVNGSLHEIVNETAPSGIYSIELQPTGGGMPNPDFYRLIPTVEGYNSMMPHIDFEVDGATTIYAYLDPTGGAPEDENKTFIDFYVRDLVANAISGATVNFGGYTLITNSAGYTMFEVDKSKTYSWTVSKSGYGSVTGNAVIGSNARHTINSVIAPAVTPTTPTAITTSTSISPTPTMTAPTGEPTSNLLEWFAAHFGMLLGGGVEIGKIFMWLCFAVPVGVYVGKEAKAGAAGFMAGAGIVTLFFVLIGWVPIWLLVLLALIIGLLYAKVFNNSDTGGGR